jgi:hypothetical protein
MAKKNLKNAYGKPVADNLNGIDTGAIQKAEKEIEGHFDQLYKLQMEKVPTGYSPEDMKKRQAFYARQEKENMAIQAKIAKAGERINSQTKKARGKSVDMIDGIPMAMPKKKGGR